MRARTSRDEFLREHRPSLFRSTFDSVRPRRAVRRSEARVQQRSPSRRCVSACAFYTGPINGPTKKYTRSRGWPTPTANLDSLFECYIATCSSNGHAKSRDEKRKVEDDYPEFALSACSAGDRGRGERRRGRGERRDDRSLGDSDKKKRGGGCRVVLRVLARLLFARTDPTSTDSTTGNNVLDLVSLPFAARGRRDSPSNGGCQSRDDRAQRDETRSFRGIPFLAEDPRSPRACPFAASIGVRRAHPPPTATSLTHELTFFLSLFDTRRDAHRAGDETSAITVSPEIFRRQQFSRFRIILYVIIPRKCVFFKRISCRT